ncbi:galactose-1-phosphate uridylyltransferase [Paraclostridium sordellii]|uniref:galactose-1-phosphate uridylyltransferase n=1 Tax=Paraclostridium sordellii TaxID=1505 RepID=UPI0030D5C95A
MKDLKVDVFSGDMIIYAPDRITRPTDLKPIKDEEEAFEEYDRKCPFCRGNERYSPEETFEIKENGKWICRSVYNKFPIIDKSFNLVKGTHEVIIDNYKHNKSFYNMNGEEFKNMFLIYQNRYKEYIGDEDVLYVSIFKNFLKKAGASLYHPHSQIISMSIIPKEIRNEIDILNKNYHEKKENLYKKIIDKEILLNERVVYNGKKFIVLVPYASIYGNEVRVICKDNSKFEDLNLNNIEELSYIFDKLFKNIYKVCGYMPFNLCLHTHPKNLKGSELLNLHFHIIPRKYSFGGFEISNGIYVSSVIPKDFANKIKFN